MNGRIRYLTDSELELFFKEARQSRRDDALFTLVYVLGLRACELVSMKLSDINFEDLTIKVKGRKGGIMRVYSAESLPSQLFNKLRKWIQIREGHPRNEFLFPHRFLALEPMTSAGVQDLFKRICEQAGIIEPHSIHDLRHSCARRLALMNLSSLRISRWLRQRYSYSADVYVDLVNDQEAEKKIREEFRLF
jgi:integrase/recombinase XerD